MLKLIEIVQSEKPDKKWKAVFEENGRRRTTHFGARGMDDFTISKDAEQARRYRARHEKDLRTNDPTRAGYLSYYILWSSPNFAENIKKYKKMFNL